MAGLIPIFPAPPRPPASGWDQNYGNELNRWLANVTEQFINFTYQKASGIMIATSFPRSAYGLRVGEGWLNVRVLTFVIEGDIGLSTVSATGSVGTITVSV
jgi:hypothetical protein